MNEEELKSIKELVRDTSRVNTYLLSALLVLFMLYFAYEIFSDIKTFKKIDFRYFNTTRSLEDIHNVSIDTKDGKIKYHH